LRPRETLEEDCKLVYMIYSTRLEYNVTITGFMLLECRLELLDIAKRIKDSAYFLNGGVQSSDASVIYNIQCLKAMLVKAEDEANCTGLVYSVLNKESRKVNFKAPDSNGPEMSLKRAERLLDKLESKKWTLETLKSKFPDECKAALNLEESCPDIEAGYQDVIKAFEV
jgi:hypothetical protein